MSGISTLNATIKITANHIRCNFTALVIVAAFAFVVINQAGNLNAAESTAREGEGPAVAVEHEAFFSESVLPLLQTHCFKCHADEHEKGGLRLDVRSRLMIGGESGPAIDFDLPADSVLLQAVRYEGYEMPPRGKLDDADIATLEKWVALGAPYSADRIGVEEEQKPEAPGAVISDLDKAFWSFQPIVDHRPPLCASHPIDGFVDALLVEQAVAPVDPARPRELIRRLSFDLTGLPPEDSLVEAFEREPTEMHYLRIVEQMLASPTYGERWARHWLDLVRWAETNSYERDGDKPEAWRYRQYVIDSFNQDRPYDEFAAQQLAGDEMPFSESSLIATGYYRLGIWDDEPADPEQALYDDLDDIVAVTSQVFLGLTVNCARCHEHKIDPITHADYYRTLAFFAGLNRFGVRGPESVEQFSLRPLAPHEDRQRISDELTAFTDKMQQLDHEIKAVEQRAKPLLLPVEKQEFFHESNRPWILAHYIDKGFTKSEVDQYAARLSERAELNRNRPAEIARALVVTEIGSEPRATNILIRGNVHAPGEPVEPGFLEVLGGGDAKVSSSPNSQTSGRRTELAKWITNPKAQPLAARVMANRVWQYHFGRGLVRTPSDFGFAGAPPTHPELLDYLASRLIEADWQLKPLHRLIVTSATYQRSSQFSDAAYTVDPENDWFWRFDPRRLSAEEVRDSMLAVAGQLDMRVGGQSVFPILEDEVLAGQSKPGQGWNQSSAADRARRSIYVYTKRSLAVPLLASFDSADTDFTCPVRFATTQPTQALGMINSEFVHQTATWMADQIRQSSASPESFVAEAIRRTTQRLANDQEIARGVQLIDRVQREHGLSYAGACEVFCLTALNLNEFIYLD